MTPPRRSPAKALPPIREVLGPEATGWDAPAGRIPDFPLPHPGGESRWAAPAARTHAGLRWRIDENWIATCSREGNIIEAVQLDARLGAELGRAGWERRIARRMHQIRIGKATKEYCRWQEHFRRHGRQPGDPETPRAVLLNSKKQFETAYAAWRVGLHRAPPASA
mmetsp:Transcript_6232/g.19342  ORF Transcript_6232/g.19342 Transcript_6232/m.19342 type:complete len:166 (-) Transcript_6232:298-795(-)